MTTSMSKLFLTLLWYILFIIAIPFVFVWLIWDMIKAVREEAIELLKKHKNND